MAVDALEYDESAEDANPAGALEEILENPERLKDLDLDAFAEELERQVTIYSTILSSGKFKLTIPDMKSIMKLKKNVLAMNGYWEYDPVIGAKWVSSEEKNLPVLSSFFLLHF